MDREGTETLMELLLMREAYRIVKEWRIAYKAKETARKRKLLSDITITLSLAIVGGWTGMLYIWMLLR